VVEVVVAMVKVVANHDCLLKARRRRREEEEGEGVKITTPRGRE